MFTFNLLSMSFCDSRENTVYIRLRYSRRIDKKFFCEEYFYGLFDGIAISHISLLKQVYSYFVNVTEIGTHCGRMSIG